MKTIYLREKKSGNFEFSNRKQANLKFSTKKEFKKWFDEQHRYYSGRIIKATYSRSQTYYVSNDFENVWKKAKEIFC